MKFKATFSGRVVGPGGRPVRATELEARLDAVMARLLKLEVVDPAISATGRRGRVVVEFEVDAADLEEAQRRSPAILRGAIDAAGGLTPDWSVHWVRAETSEVGTAIPA